MKKVILLGIALCFMIFSCGEQEASQVEPRTNYQSFERELTKVLDQVAIDLRNNDSDFSNAERVKKSVESTLLSNSSKDRDEFSTNFDKALSWSKGGGVSARKEPTVINVSQFEYDILTKVDALWKSSGDGVAYKEGLENLLDEVSANKIDQVEKEPIMLFLVSYKVAFDFVQNNRELSEKGSVSGRTEGWWDSWGRCAAGIIGGAGTGGLTGLFVGVAVGTVVLPGVGTASAAVIAGAIGSISGGMVGAASSCNSNNGGGRTVVYINICEDEATRDTCVLPPERISITDKYRPLFNFR